MIAAIFKSCGEFKSRYAVVLAVVISGAFCLISPAQGQQVTQPVVGVLDSELTRALTTMPAVPPTPNTYPDTGFQWWEPDWNYFVMPDSLKETFASDGTAFTVIGDSNVSSGLLLTNGLPKYPIIFCLASEAIRNDEIASFTNYVAAGGFLFISGPAFSRDTNGVTLGDFAFANEMGVHMVLHGVTNYGADSTITRLVPHTLVNHLPPGQLTWRLPAYSEEINWGVSPSHSYMNPHDIWQITASDATVLAQGDNYPYLTVKAYGKGYFIYEAPLNPIVSHGGFGPGMYSYVILRRAVEWAFSTQNVPLPKLSPWPYQYDAAFMMRHDLEDYANEMADILLSAKVETSNNVHGDYYLCTGTVRVDMTGLGYNTNTVIQNMRTAMTTYGATISSHNGGLKNANNSGLVSTNYDYWHWGTDEPLDLTPPGYASGAAYSTASLSNSMNDIESWLSGLMKPSMRTWVACNFNATREASYSLQSQLGFKILGDQKISPFPHWTLSTQTPDKKYAMLTEPVSEWFVNGALAQSLEPWHPPGVQDSASLHTSVDFYYNLGTLVNFYSHTLSTGEGDAGQLTPDYMTYSINTNKHPKLWNTNGIGIYQWWLTRSNVQITVSSTTNGLKTSATYTIKNATDPNTAIELLTPGGLGFCSMTVTTNGVAAGSNIYRVLNNQLIRVKVGASVTNAVISYYPQVLGALVYSENFDETNAPALPTGWTSTATGAQSAWITKSSINDTAPNSVSASDIAGAGQAMLVSPSIFVPTNQSQLSFRNNYNLEPSIGMSGLDGGVLEIKIGTNSFVDIISAGGSFVAGGYTGTMETATGNALGDRQAWSGNSGGFITTIVNLPASSAGQTNQFRWVCSTDNNNGAGNFTGWQIDTIAITNLVCATCPGGTNAPVLPAQSNQTINEQTPLTVTNTATDPDGAGTLLNYVLTNAPSGAQIDFNGIITWTPTEAQGPSTNTITTIVTDCTGRSATNSFQVFVNEINTPPVFNGLGTQTVNEQTPLTVTNAATDSDLPANTLTYQLVSPPSGMSINTNTGVITWTPTEAQGPSTNTITTVVTDYNPWAVNAQHMSATNTFTVIVNEINTPPTLTPLVQTNFSVNELSLLTFTNTATDTDIPANTLTFSLLNAPTGASIGSSSGIFTWIPSGTQGPSTNIIGIVVTDFNPWAVNSQHMSATNYVQVVVNDTATCQYASVFQQNFDGTTAPALPAGWTSTPSQAGSNWVTTTVSNSSAPNAAFVADAVNVGTSLLISPVIAMPSGSSVLSFKNNFNLEVNTNNTNDGYDGGVLEIKIGNGSFTDIITAGGSFTSGGYNSVIDPAYGNPLASRSAWSGNSHGFITTTVNLPSSASSTNIQLRWNCGSDNGNVFVGWWIDTITISNLTCTTGPQLPNQSGVTIGEFSTLRVTNTATEGGSPPPTFTYQLISPPAGALIDTNGIITWSPAQTQSPGTNSITTVVTDNSQPTNLTATNSFQVIVTEVNVAPTPPSIALQNVNELAQLTVNDAASETNIHATTTGYSMVGPLAGMNITSAGIFTWTPSQNQSPSTNTVTVVVSNSDPFDTVNPILTATNTFTVVVKEVNVAPSLPSINPQTIGELLPLTVTNTATNANIHSTVSGYTLVGALTGMNISSNGIFTWTPSQNQSPSTNTVTTVVTNSNPYDSVNPKLTATNTFTVVVKEINVAPVPTAIPQQTVNEQAPLIVTNTATEPNAHATTTGWGLINPLPGMNMTVGGVFTWTPNQNQSPSTNTVSVVVTNSDVFDLVNPSLTATNTFTVVVKEVNIAPVPAAISQQTVNELTPLSVTNTATEPNIHATTAGWGLISPLPGMNMTAGGVFTWTPSQNQSPSTNTVTVVVTNNDAFDTVNPTLTATNTFTVVVREVNQAPVPPVIALQTINEHAQLTVNDAATESNIHATITGYTILSPLTGMNITSNGLFTWTPDDTQSPSTNTVTIVVSNNDAFDLVNPVLTATNSFTVVVKEVNIAPVPAAIPPQTVDEQAMLTVTNTATEPNAHATTTGWGLINALPGMNITAGGIFTWTPGQNQSPSTNTVTVVVTNSDVLDTVNPSLTATNTFTVVVREVNIAPVPGVIPPQTVDEQVLLTVTNTATEPNIHATTTGWGLISPLPGMNITAGGIFSWTPNQNQSPSTNTVTVVVTNNDAFDTVNPNLTATNTFTVVVKEVNEAPVLPVIPPQSVAVLGSLTVTNTATEPNIHATTLGYGLIAPPSGLTIDGNGIITWSPGTNMAGTTNAITTVVTNSDVFDTVNPHLTATNTFQVVVNGVHNGPSLLAKSDVTINSLTTLIVTNAATDTDIPFTGLTYQLVNPPLGAVIDGTGTISWSPTSAQASSTNLITTVVVDGTYPPLSATNSFNVVVDPVVPPMILSIDVTNNAAVITWSGTMNHTYRLQFMNLGDTNWTEVPADITLTNGPTGSTTNSCGNAGTEFYRVTDTHVTVSR